MKYHLALFIPNRTFLVRFGGISGEFARARLPKARRNEPYMAPKRTNKERLWVIMYLPYPNSAKYSGQNRFVEAIACQVRIANRVGLLATIYTFLVLNIFIKLLW